MDDMQLVILIQGKVWPIDIRHYILAIAQFGNPLDLLYLAGIQPVAVFGQIIGYVIEQILEGVLFFRLSAPMLTEQGCLSIGLFKPENTTAVQRFNG